LLDAHAAIATRLNDTAPVSSAGSSQVLLLQAEVRQLSRALAQAGAASELVADDSKVRLIPADVIPLASTAGFLQRVALARGSVDGVEAGLPVLADGVLVGRVASVTRSTCEVLLATDPTFRVRATLSRDGNDVEGMLTGDGSTTLVFEPVVLDDTQAGPTLRVGETVIASRASVLCGVPALLGVVATVERRAGDAQPRARVQPGVDLTALERVVIVRSLGDGA
jgi:rod shape-determining protein MreC